MLTRLFQCITKNGSVRYGIRRYCNLKPNSRCSFCGEKFPEELSPNQPRRCSSCGNTTYSNPLPVVVGIIHKKTELGISVLGIRRGIEPCIGQIALIGGFLESGEKWQNGLSREVKEEVGLSICETSWKLQDVQTVLSPPRLVVSATAECSSDINIEKLSYDPQEVQEPLWIDKPIELCFPTHTIALSSFFDKFNNKS